MDNRSIKTNILNFRKQRKMTQEEVAELLGISATAYRDLEKGNTSILNQNIAKLAKLLNISTEELVLGYTPAQIQDTTVEELKEEYGNKLENLNNRIIQLEKLVQSQSETIDSKNEIITMLKKMLGEEK